MIPLSVETKQRLLLLSCRVLLLAVVLIIPAVALSANINVPQTGQSVVYGAGDDGDLQKGVGWPLPRFVINTDGTVTDILTNLVWLENANCYGNMSWGTALSNAAALKNGDCGLSDTSLAGDWRLPNVRELESLLHLGENTPAVPNTAGTGSATNGNPFVSLQQNYYWSSSSNTSGPSQAFSVSLRYGHIVLREKSNSISTIFVRNNNGGTPLAHVYATGQSRCYDSAGVETSCIDTGQDADEQAGLSWPVPRFTDNGDGTISDNLSGLRWLKNANCLGITNWNTALTWANTLKNGSCGLTDGSEELDWRLPNRKELMSLADYGNNSPALPNTNGDGRWTANDPFVSVQSASYFSSSTYDAFSGYAWNISFQAGTTGTIVKTALGYAWAVRDEVVSRNLTVTFGGVGSGTITSTPAGISCPGVCSADFARNSMVTLSAKPVIGFRVGSWSIASCGSNSSCNVNMSEDQAVTVSFVEASSTEPAWIILLMD